jgi:ABC-type amino acid transport substrate-binding protein
MDIKHGKSIAAIAEPMVVDALQQQMPEIKVMELALKEEEQGMGHGIGMSKNNQQLVAAVEKAVSQLKADGTLAALEHKWFVGGCHDSE